jgi:hypothetical protein
MKVLEVAILGSNSWDILSVSPLPVVTGIVLKQIEVSVTNSTVEV